MPNVELVANFCRWTGEPDRLAAWLVVVSTHERFHFYRRELDQFPDPELAHRRRGAPFTFDLAKFRACVDVVRNTGVGSAPSFDHSVGDPSEDTYRFDASIDIVIAEGNYLSLDDDGWRDLRALFDVAVFLDCDIDVAMERFVVSLSIGPIGVVQSIWRAAL